MIRQTNVHKTLIGRSSPHVPCSDHLRLGQDSPQVQIAGASDGLRDVLDCRSDFRDARGVAC